MALRDDGRLTPAVTPNDHAEGPEDAAVTLVEYGDYECPHCGRAYPIIKQIQERFGAGLRFVFRNFPLTEAHAHAQHAAEAAESAAVMGRFWQMHDALFEHQRALGDRDLVAYGAAVGVDESQLARDLAEHTYASRVREDFRSGVRSGVNGTPTFFINGIRYDDAWDLESLTEALRTETLAQRRRRS
jgi:protein-disulfide isomerase